MSDLKKVFKKNIKGKCSEKKEEKLGVEQRIIHE